MEGIYDTGRRRGRDSRVGQDLSKAFRLKHKCTKSIHCRATRFRAGWLTFTPTKPPPPFVLTVLETTHERVATTRRRYWSMGILRRIRPRSANLLDLGRPLSPPSLHHLFLTFGSVPVQALYTWPRRISLRNNSASRRLLMDSEVATISTRRNNVTLIYLRFNLALGSRCSRLWTSYVISFNPCIVGFKRM